MVRGHRPALVTKMPFSVDIASRGNPCEFHVLTVYESAITAIRLRTEFNLKQTYKLIHTNDILKIVKSYIELSNLRL